MSQRFYMFMGRILHTDGRVVFFRIPNLNFRLEFLQQHLGGIIEPLSDLPDGMVLLVGDSLIGEASINVTASLLTGQVIAGKAILLEREETEIQLT